MKYKYTNIKYNAGVVSCYFMTVYVINYGINFIVLALYYNFIFGSKVGSVCCEISTFERL